MVANFVMNFDMSSSRQRPPVVGLQRNAGGAARRGGGRCGRCVDENGGTEGEDQSGTAAEEGLEGEAARHPLPRRLNVDKTIIWEGGEPRK